MTRRGTGSGWAVVRLARTLGHRFAVGWRAVPEAARRGWMVGVAAAFVAAIALIAGLEWAGMRLADNGVLEWEADMLRALDDDGPLSFSTAVWIQTLGTDITLVILGLTTAGIAAWMKRPLRALTIVFSVALLDPIIRVGWAMWDRARPTVIMDGVASPGFASFPSGHTAKSIALYGVLVYLWARASDSWLERGLAGIVLIAIATLVMVGRLRMGVHWPSDVMAGALLGGVWVVMLIALLRRSEPPPA